MAEKVVGTARKKNAAPAGLQKVLNRLAKLALSNSPCCFYECFATALETDVDWRTLVELQLAPCKSVIIDVNISFFASWREKAKKGRGKR